MISIFYKCLFFLGIIFFAYFLKKIGLLGDRSRIIVSKAVFNVTLPATIISGFATFHPNPSFFIVCILGLACNFFVLFWGLSLTRMRNRNTRILYSFNMAGYNIGCFALPFAQSILGPEGIVATCMFDVGNSLMNTGGSYAIIKSIVQKKTTEENFSLLANIKALFTSVPFDTYMLMLILAIANISVPPAIINITNPISSINAYLSMFMLGLIMELSFDLPSLRFVGRILAFRYIANFLLATLICFSFSFSKTVQQVIYICLLAPISALAAIFVDKLGGDFRLSGFAASASIAISMIILPIIFFIM